MILNIKIDKIIFKRERCNHVETFQKFKRNDFSIFFRKIYLSISSQISTFSFLVNSQKYIILQKKLIFLIFSISKLLFLTFIIKNVLDKKFELSRDTLNFDVF